MRGVAGSTRRGWRRRTTCVAPPDSRTVAARNATPTFRPARKRRSSGRSHAHRTTRGKASSAEAPKRGLLRRESERRSDHARAGVRTDACHSFARFCFGGAFPALRAPIRAAAHPPGINALRLSSGAGCASSPRTSRAPSGAAPSGRFRSRVETGRVLGVAGENGSGKTTLLKTLAGLIRPSGGYAKIFLDGEERRRGHEPRDVMPAHRVVRARSFAVRRVDGRGEPDFLRKGQRHRRAARPRAKRFSRGSALPESSYSKKALWSLSTGQRQRVKLAFATLHEPDLLLLDEPGANLDEAGRSIVQKVVAAQRLRGITVIASNDPRDLALSDETSDALVSAPRKPAAVLPAAIAVFRRELLAEWRTRVAVNSLFLFAFAVLVLVAYAVGPTRLSPGGQAHRERRSPLDRPLLLRDDGPFAHVRSRGGRGDRRRSSAVGAAAGRCSSASSSRTWRCSAR